MQPLRSAADGQLLAHHETSVDQISDDSGNGGLRQVQAKAKLAAADVTSAGDLGKGATVGCGEICDGHMTILRFRPELSNHPVSHTETTNK